MIESSNDETNFPHKLLLTHTEIWKIGRAFTSGPSANIKFSKTQSFKMIQSGGVILGIPIFGNILSSVARRGTYTAKIFG